MRVMPLIIAAGLALTGFHPPSTDTDRAEVVGVLREALTGKLLPGVAVSIGDATGVSDQNGRFVLSVVRGESLLTVAAPGYLEFQYPFLQVGQEGRTVEIELRTDPLRPEMFAMGNLIPYLCIVDDEERLTVRHRCAREALMGYQTRIIKHNPWNPYFGPAADRSGVLLATTPTRD